MTAMLLALGGIFGALAACSAFLITWKGYAHHLTDRKKILKASLQTAVITFIFFMILTGFFALIVKTVF
jgi:hypothetical protein